MPPVRPFAATSTDSFTRSTVGRREHRSAHRAAGAPLRRLLHFSRPHGDPFQCTLLTEWLEKALKFYPHPPF
jgi:hypothetical protein